MLRLKLKLTIPFFLLALLSLTASGAAYYNTNFGFKKKLSLRFSTTSQTIFASNCSGITSVRSYIGSTATNVTSPITVDLTATGGITFYSDAYCTTPITNVTIATGSNTASFYFLSDSVGTGVITASATSFPPFSQSETLNTNPYIWTGNGGTPNWNTAGNWSGNAVPPSGQIAVFNTACGGNCTVTTTANVSVGGVRMAPGYTGTITQGAGFTITASSWTQLAGSFQGGDSTKTITDFNLYGGSYVASTGTTVINGTYLVSGSPSATFTSSTFSFGSSSAYRTIKPGSFMYENVTVGSSGGCYNKGHAIDGTFNVKNLRVYCTNDYTLALNTGVVNIHENLILDGRIGGTGSVNLVGTGSVTSSAPTFGVGNLNINTSGTYTFVGTFYITGTYVLTSGTINAGTSKVIFFTTGNQSITPGNANYNDVELGGHNGCYNITQAIVGTLKVKNLSTYCSTAFRAYLTSGTIEVSGNLYAQGLYVGPGVIKMVGSGTITGEVGSRLPVFVIDTAGSYTLAGTLRFTAEFTVQSGTVNPGTSTVIFAPNDADYVQVISPGSATFDSVDFGDPSGCYKVKQSVVGTLAAKNVTLFCGDTSEADFQSGTVTASGNLTIAAKVKGNAEIKMIGSGTISGTATNYAPNLTIDTSGTYSLSGTIVLAESYTLTSGTINAGTSTLRLEGRGKTITPGSATYATVSIGRGSCSSTGLTFSGTMKMQHLIFACGDSITHTLNSGTLEVLENVTVNANTKIQGTTAVLLTGAAPATITQGVSGSYPLNFTISKDPGTVVTLSTDVNLDKTGHVLNVTSGNINMAGKNLTIRSNLSLNGNTLTKGGGVLTVNSIVAGTGSLYGGTVNP